MTAVVNAGVMMLAAAFLAAIAAGCQRQVSPLEEMFSANTRGEVACVRDGLLKRGRENCK